MNTQLGNAEKVMLLSKGLDQENMSFHQFVDHQINEIIVCDLHASGVNVYTERVKRILFSVVVEKEKVVLPSEEILKENKVAAVQELEDKYLIVFNTHNYKEVRNFVICFAGIDVELTKLAVYSNRYAVEFQKIPEYIFWNKVKTDISQKYMSLREYLNHI